MSVGNRGWFCLKLVVPVGDTPRVLAIFWKYGIQGLEERPRARGVELVAYSESEPQLRSVAVEATALLGWSPSFCESHIAAHTDDAWATAWTTHLEPKPLGSGFLLVPTHSEAPAIEGRQAIFYAPELAFGDGGHATTRLAAAEVERVCRSRSSCRVLDVGAGNGALSFIAHYSGAERVIGLEIEPVALAAARRNAVLNAVPPERCRFSSESLDGLDQEFDLVVANVEVRPLLGLIPSMARVLARGGEWVLTGFLGEAEESVERALALSGGEVRARVGLEGWMLISARLGNPGAVRRD